MAGGEGGGEWGGRREVTAAYGRAEWRIELFSVGVGMLGTAVIACVASFAAGLSFLIGASMSWLNFRWLKQGVNALVGLSIAQPGTQEAPQEEAGEGAAEGAQKARVPAGVYVKFAGRYLLLLLVAYVILSRLRWPATYLIAGLFVVVAAVLLELVLELLGVVPGAKITDTLRQG